MSEMPAPQKTRPKCSRKILELVAHFREAKNHKMVETVLRQQFLDKFFVELGWDVTNNAGKIGREMEVDLEQSIETREGRTEHKRAPDYSFRVDGKTKFFVEAKKPSVDILGGIGPAYQVRRYGWSAKLGVSILTDFEEFAVYDCRVKPKAGDKASVARLFYCTFEEYAERWEEIAGLFSREAVHAGKLDAFIGAGKKKGVVAVNDDFLHTIESWRDELARHLAVRNPELSQDELNFAVTKIIDRIIFLRIAEDRNIENEGTLQRIAERDGTYAELKKHFTKADEKYNSGLFHFRAEPGVTEGIDTITPKLQIDDGILKKIINELYFPRSEYEFSVMPADILGQVYEQFLGKVIRLTDGHRAKVEEKPEVRKAGGVYYTPEYIVDYIVQNTVGKLCESKTPKQIAELKIVDPACGSGSFLIGAYQYLLDWHLEYYTKHLKTYADKLYSVKGKKYLTIAERKRILLNNIYGVDIDANAVEVTKLSLLLKTLEGEVQPSLFHERVLPDLSRNIQCGNSLIGTDFHVASLFAEDDVGRMKVNAFDWEAGFPEVFAQGGFDAVIGNPPYIRARELPVEQKMYFEANYSTAKNQYDIYAVFIEKSLGLVKPNGLVSFITPNKFLVAQYGFELRKFICENSKLIDFQDHSKKDIFGGVSVYPIVFVLQQGRSAKKCGDNFDLLQVFGFKKEDIVIQRMKKAELSLGDVCTIKEAVHTGNIREKLICDNKRNANCFKLLRGQDCNRYTIKWAGLWVDYSVTPNKSKKEYANLIDKSHFEGEKLFLREIALRPSAVFDDENYFSLNKAYVLKKKSDCELPLKYILGVINSKAAEYFFEKEFGDIRVSGGYLQFKKQFSSQIPIPTSSKSQHDRVVALVEQMLALQKKLPALTLPHDRESLSRQIAATDRQIDELVFELYGLSEEERKVVLNS